MVARWGDGIEKEKEGKGTNGSLCSLHSKWDTVGSRFQEMGLFDSEALPEEGERVDG